MKKRILSIILVVSMIFGMAAALSVSVGAETLTSGDYEYAILDDGTVKIVRYNGSATKLDIPSEIDGKKVTGIGENAFADCESLTSVIIPNGVTNIGIWAFDYCESLTSVTIPDSVTSIGGKVFRGCKLLADINVSAGNKNYCSDNGVLFDKNKTNLIQYPIGKSNKSYTIPNSVTSIGYGAFMDCISLTRIAIPNSVISIGEFAFGLCTSLTSMTIPDSVTKIDDQAFVGCELLTNITIPDSVTYIGDYAFMGCASLASVTIPDSVTSIDYATFSDCTSLASVTIPDSVTIIGWSSFENCTSLSNITIPDSVDRIDYGAFQGCTSLKSVTIPDNVTSIGNYAFDGCTSLTSINVSANNEDYSSDNGVLFKFYKYRFINETELVQYPAGKSDKNYNIPDTVTGIGTRAFAYCKSLTSVTIPDSVTEIYSDAFDGCTSLTSINVSANNEDYSSDNGVLFDKNKTELVQYPAGKSDKNYIIPDSVTDIGYEAFYGCTALTRIAITNSVISIGTRAFAYCKSLTSVTIPDSVTEIYNDAFDGCTLLTSINVSANNEDYSSDNGVLFNKDKTELIQYPAGKSDKNYTIPNGVTSISRWAFDGCTSLTSINVSANNEDYSSDNGVLFNKDKT